jgi:hypothetical protein
MRLSVWRRSGAPTAGTRTRALFWSTCRRYKVSTCVDGYVYIRRFVLSRFPSSFISFSFSFSILTLIMIRNDSNDGDNENLLANPGYGKAEWITVRFYNVWRKLQKYERRHQQSFLSIRTSPSPRPTHTNTQTPPSTSTHQSATTKAPK